jgi:hypothetical protein
MITTKTIASTQGTLLDSIINQSPALCRDSETALSQLETLYRRAAPTSSAGLTASTISDV